MRRQLQQIKYMAGLLLAAVLLAACSSDSEEEKRENMFNLANLRFSVSESGFDEDVDLAARSTEDNVVHREIVDLGDGLEAEVTIERDIPAREEKVLTRALPTSTLRDGTYRLLIFKKVPDLLRADLTYQCSNGVLTLINPATAPWIPLSSHHFILFRTDGKIDFNEQACKLEIDDRADLLEAFYTWRVITLSAISSDSLDLYGVHPAGARLRIRVLAGAPFEAGISATLTPSGNNISGSGYLQLHNDITNGANTWKVGTGQTSLSKTVIISENLGYEKNYTKFSYQLCRDESRDYYEHFFAGTPFNQLKLTFNSGTVYGKSLAGKSVVFTGENDRVMKRRESYLVRVNLVNAYTYLFSDGTTGTLAANPGRIPVGVVVDAQNRLAIALKDANNGQKVRWALYANPSVGLLSNQAQYPNLADAIGDNQGYEHTYDGDILAKINYPSVFPAFYHAGQYTTPSPPGVTWRWFLPSMGQWQQAMKTLGFVEGNPTQTQVIWGVHAANSAFIRPGVNGDPILTNHRPPYGKEYWTSTERDRTEAYYVSMSPSNLERVERVMRRLKDRKQTFYRVRPFLKY